MPDLEVPLVNWGMPLDSGLPLWVGVPLVMWWVPLLVWGALRQGVALWVPVLILGTLSNFWLPLLNWEPLPSVCP